jgi:hypothetical protein
VLLPDPASQHSYRCPDRFLLPQARTRGPRGVIHHIHQTSAGSPLFKPRMETTIQLHQVPKVLPPFPALPVPFPSSHVSVPFFTRRSSLVLIAVLFNRTSSGGRSLGDISNGGWRGHYQRGSTRVEHRAGERQRYGLGGHLRSGLKVRRSKGCKRVTQSNPPPLFSQEYENRRVSLCMLCKCGKCWVYVQIFRKCGIQRT